MGLRLLLLALVAVTASVCAAEFRFIQALRKLDTTEKKLEHLRSWQPGLAEEIGGSERDGYGYLSLSRVMPHRSTGDRFGGTGP